VSIPSLLSGEVWPVDALSGSYSQMLAGVHGHTSLTAALRNQGFVIRMAPTNWSRSECGAVVDECRKPSRYNEHWNFLIRSTPLPDLLPRLFPHPWPPGGIETLRQIGEFGVADRHLTFVHSLASHPPAVLDADCAMVPVADGELRAQLECTHDVLFAGVSTIDLTTDVVVIAADHGYLTGSLDIDPAQWRDETLRDRFSAFVAVSTPAGCEDTMPERLSTAQILPYVLNCYDAALAVPDHRFIKVIQLNGGGIDGYEVDWDGWSIFTPSAVPVNQDVPDR
jgi:hypothetical protein